MPLLHATTSTCHPYRLSRLKPIVSTSLGYSPSLVAKPSRASHFYLLHVITTASCPYRVPPPKQISATSHHLTQIPFTTCCLNCLLSATSLMHPLHAITATCCQYCSPQPNSIASTTLQRTQISSTARRLSQNNLRHIITPHSYSVNRTRSAAQLTLGITHNYLISSRLYDYLVLLPS